MAANGQEALEAFQLAFDEGAPYNLVCLDIMMPDLDGHTVLKAMRKFEAQKNSSKDDRAKILMTTGLADKESVIHALKNECNGYLLKPILRQKVVEKFKELKMLPADYEDREDQGDKASPEQG